MDTTQLIVLIVVAVAVAGPIWFLASRRKTPSGISSTTTKPARGLGGALRNIWGGGLSDDSWDALEAMLLSTDLGVAATQSVVSAVRKRSPESVEDALGAVGSEIRGQLMQNDRSLDLSGKPAVVLVVGVNGSGKTTTIAKLAKRFKDQNLAVVLGAADTFRAAAAEQLTTWGDRLGFRVVRGSEGADPASVAHDALTAAQSSNTDVLLIDTAGRLHGKKNLMAELGKIYRVVGGDKGSVGEVLLVLDATAGQNGLAQVREFASTVPLTGIVLTKLDGTARGGIVVAVEKDLGVPVKFVGVGEGMDDLQPFDPDRFVADLMEAS
ncbi:MAG TPA: signal recognition particle-docking protein FtsY [Acidimicrobiia bacterium]